MKSTEKTAGLLKTIWSDWYAPIKQKRLNEVELERFDKYENLRIKNEIQEKRMLNTAENEIIVENNQFQFERIERLKSRFVRNELINQMNIESVVDKAQQLLPEEITSDPVDEDWFRIFINKAKQFSDSHIQNLWAKILAGELQQPSKFSLKTLSTLEIMNISDVELFKYICNNIIGDSLLFYDEEIFIKYFNIKYFNLLHLSNLGLIYHSLTLSKEFNIDENNINKDIITIKSNDMILKYRFNRIGCHNIHAIILSQIGKELSEFSDLNFINNYYEYSKEYINKYKIPISIYCCDVLKESDDVVLYSLDEKLLYKFE